MTTIADVAVAARHGQTELIVTPEGMAELVDILADDERFGQPVPPPFWLYGVWICCAEPTTPAAV